MIKKMYLNKLETEGKSKTTIANSDRAITEFLTATGLNSENINEISDRHIDIYMNYLLDRGNSANSRKTKVAYVRTFVKFLFNRKYITENVMAEVKVKAPEAKIQRIPKSDLDRMFAEAKKDFESGKDLDSYIIMMLLFQSGVRVDCELFNLTYDDIEDEGIHIIGKGGKLRFVPLKEEMVADIRAYYEATRNRLKPLSKEEFESARTQFTYKGFKDYNGYLALRNEASQRNFLFLTMAGTQRTNNSLFAKLKKYQQRCGIESSVSAHKFRHSFAVNLLEQEVPLDVISRVMGHADVGITSRIYAKTDDKRVTQALSNVTF